MSRTLPCRQSAAIDRKQDCFDCGSAGGVVPREDATITATKTAAWSKCHRDPMVRQHSRRRRTAHAQQPASPLVGADFARRATGCRTWPTCYPAARHSLAGMAASHSADLFGNHIRPHLVDRGWVRVLCNARVISSHHHVDLDLWSGLRSEDGRASAAGHPGTSTSSRLLTHC
jgi:hypothetical protein